MKTTLGIDLGATQCAGAFLQDGAPVAVTFSASGKRTMPAVVYYGPEETLVGEEAEELWKRVHEHGFPERKRLEVLGRMVSEIKGRLGPGGKHALPGRVVSHEQVLTDLFGRMKAEAEAQCAEGSPEGVVLAHSVRMLEPVKELLRAAARRAGFTDVALLEKPVAAAMGYAAAGEKVGNNILVYDLGPATFEVALVTRREDGSYAVIDSASDASCGGGEFDYLIYDCIEAQLGTGGAQAGQVDRVLLEKCRGTKEALSRKACDTLFINRTGEDGQPDVDDVLLTRETFEALIRPTIDNTVRLAAQVGDAAKSQGHEADTLVLVGASTQIPLIVQCLRERLGDIKSIYVRHFDTAVALGAATSSLPPLPKKIVAVPAAVAKNHRQPRQAPKKDWYYAENSEQKGPVSAAELRELLASGKLPDDVLVFKEGTGNWKSTNEVPELKSAS